MNGSEFNDASDLFLACICIIPGCGKNIQDNSVMCPVHTKIGYAASMAGQVPIGNDARIKSEASMMTCDWGRFPDRQRIAEFDREAYCFDDHGQLVERLPVSQIDLGRS